MGARHKMTDEKIAEAKRLRSQGMLGKEIAAVLGVHESTIWNHISGIYVLRSRAKGSPQNRLAAERIRCTRCGEEKNNSEFYRWRVKNRLVVPSACKSCTLERDADARLKWCFGIDLKQYGLMLGRQGGKCAICATDDPEYGRRKVKRFSVDHDHDTGRVRGLLCHKCNAVLGLSGDSLDVLRAAVRYLERQADFSAKISKPADACSS